MANLKCNRDLTQSLDQTPSEAFARSGTLDIAGNVAVVDDEGIIVEPSSLHCESDSDRCRARTRCGRFTEPVSGRR